MNISDNHKKLESHLSANFNFRINDITGAIEVQNEKSEMWDELNEFNIYRRLRIDGYKISLNELIYLLKSDFVAKYNPFKNYFENLPSWNESEIDFIYKLSSYIKVTSQERFQNHLKKWLVRTVKCALCDEYLNKNALILVHDKQNSGKTTFIRFLCPPVLKDYFTENISFDKDSMIALIENFIINLDELATFSKVEIGQLKSVLSKSFVKERHPFERKAKKLPRRASFIGSTNMTEFLTDPTGNVRWIPFEVFDIDWKYSKEINIDDVWRQSYSLYKCGFDCDITAEEIKENEVANKNFLIITPEMELIMKNYFPGRKDDHDLFRTTTEIEMALREECGDRIKISNQQVGKALKILNYARDNRYAKEKDYPSKAYYLKFREK